jgi:hypothetical protein
MGQMVTLTDERTDKSDVRTMREPLWLSGKAGETTCLELAGTEISAVAEHYMAEIREEMWRLSDGGVISWGDQSEFAYLAGMIDKLDEMTEAHSEGRFVSVEVDIDEFRRMARRAANEYAGEIADVLRGEDHEPRLQTSRQHFCAMMNLLEAHGWPVGEEDDVHGPDASSEIARLKAIEEMVR